MKDTALGVHLVKLKAARFGDAQEAVGNNPAVRHGREILGIAFNQPRHFNRDRIAGIGSRSPELISASLKPVNCRTEEI
jgi:hypothetical protein